MVLCLQLQCPTISPPIINARLLIIYDKMPIHSTTIHILGLGNLGKLVAHALRKSHPEKQISLLFHRESLAEEWHRSGRCIDIERDGVSDRRDGFGEENTKEGGVIHNLVLATKTHATVQALLPVKERLGSDSTVLFVQNGMGMSVK
jgi:2-dehydropantoate 2-reductase